MLAGIELVCYRLTINGHIHVSIYLQYFASQLSGEIGDSQLEMSLCKLFALAVDNLT